MGNEMSSPEDRERGSRRRKRNRIARILHDPNEFRGAFSLKVHEDKKSTYHRQKLRVQDVDEYKEEEDELETIRKDS